MNNRNITDLGIRQITNNFGTLILASLSIIMGIICFLTNDPRLLSVRTPLAYFLISGGILELFLASANFSREHGWGWLIWNGVIDVLFGVFFLIMTESRAFDLFPFILGVWTMIRSSLNLGHAVDAHKFGFKHRMQMVTLVIISIIFSFIYVISPSFNYVNVGRYALSTSFLFYGLFRMMFYINFKRRKASFN